MKSRTGCGTGEFLLFIARRYLVLFFGVLFVLHCTVVLLGIQYSHSNIYRSIKKFPCLDGVSLFGHVGSFSSVSPSCGCLSNSLYYFPAV
jgi:hypothetical protein